MEKIINQVNSAHQGIGKTSGQMLREARTQANLTQENIASQLHLKVPVIRDLENDNYPTKSTLVFMKGYLRAYGKVLGIPQEKLLEGFSRLGIEAPTVQTSLMMAERQSQQKNEVLQEKIGRTIHHTKLQITHFINQTFNKSKSRRFGGGNIDSQVRKISAIVAGIVLLIIFITWQLTHRGNSMHKEVLPPETAQVTQETPATAAPTNENAPTNPPATANNQAQTATPAKKNNTPALNMDLGNNG